MFFTFVLKIDTTFREKYSFEQKKKLSISKPLGKLKLTCVFLKLNMFHHFLTKYQVSSIVQEYFGEWLIILPISIKEEDPRKLRQNNVNMRDQKEVR